MDDSRRHFLRYLLLGSSLLGLPRISFAGAQKEEHLADSVASAMRSSIYNVNPPKLIFSTKKAADNWYTDMDKRLSRYLSIESERSRILVNLQYEATRAGLDPQLILGLTEVESRFRRYAISTAGARGLMQVMPFWVNAIGNPSHNLFDTRTNLRYGCVILRYYLDRENGNLFRALGRYNGSLGQRAYPDAVLGAMNRNWLYND